MVNCCCYVRFLKKKPNAIGRVLSSSSSSVEWVVVVSLAFVLLCDWLAAVLLLLVAVVREVVSLVIVFALSPSERILVCCSLDWFRDLAGVGGVGVAFCCGGDVGVIVRVRAGLTSNSEGDCDIRPALAVAAATTAARPVNLEEEVVVLELVGSRTGTGSSGCIFW